MILPKDHAANLFELSDDIAANVLIVSRNMAARMTQKLDCDGFNLVQNNGEAAGQTVNHFHIHLIPRYLSDGQNINWIPSEPSVEELEEVKTQITE